MRDFTRLRAALFLAIAACGPSTAKPEEPLGNTTTDTTPSVQYSDWPVASGCGTWGQWCGPAAQVAEAMGTDSDTSCAQSFSHADLYFNIDADATSRKRADGDNTTCCYTYSDGCQIGRPLLDRGEARVAPVRDGGALPGGAEHLPAALREELARGWLADALLEHASVASFARATLELMAVGAPPDLLADCQRAGLDEVRHAQGCFALAERYAGRRLAPGPIAALPAREATLERLAVDTFVEGCVAETVATLAATRVLAACRDPEVARLLRRIVRDETRHAALAWRTVAWAVGEGGAPVADAVRAAAAAMRPDPSADAAAASDLELLAHGRLDARTRRDAAVDAWREIIDPTLALIVS
jgi:hypothetical protein